MNQHKNASTGGRNITFDNPTKVTFIDRHGVHGTIYDAKDVSWNSYPLSFFLYSGSTYLWLKRPVTITFEDNDA